MKKRWIAMLLVGCMLLGLSGCGGGKEKQEQPQEEPQQEEVVTSPPVEEEAPALEEEEPVPQEPVPGGINPLTGLPIEEEYVDNRPVAVMFNNLKAAQPQLGVSQADIIYEIPAEGGITRMLGLFQTMDGVGTLGSIRSTRTYYLEVAQGHDAVLLHAGGSPDAYEKISAWKINNIDGVQGNSSQQKIFWRDAERKKNAGYEHSLLTSGENVQGYLDGGRYETKHATGYGYPVDFVADGTPANGTDATKIRLVYSQYKTGIFEYDAATGLYMVSQYGKDYVDGNTGDQVGVTNVLVLETKINKISGDKEGRLDVDLTGEGKGTYFCGGKAIPIIWTKEDRTCPFVYHYSNGEKMPLGAGVSYVCIMDPGSSVLSVE